MPTGYTADIANGITFEQYALNCARAFGALIMMRDEPADATIPERFEPSDYHTRQLAANHARLAELDAMSLDDANAAAVEDYVAAVERHEQRLKDKAELRKKYEAMLAQVVAWRAPTEDHVKYKEFMESQIRESINWDCSTEYYAPPVRLTGATWLAEQIQATRRSITYHTEENAKEIERTTGRNEWVKALRDSLATRS